MKDDEFWMRRALEEARRGIGLTAPNPSVGAVIIQNGRELASGFHRKAGGPHAERAALGEARRKGVSVKKATIYVTLEPCSTPGRSGACTDLLRESGLAEVVYACADPNPSHAGRADPLLREAGLQVRSGVLEKEARHLIRGFASRQTRNRPWLIAKTAMSLDGRITRHPGEGQWLSSPASRARVHLLRSEVEAILTSGETVRRDDPSLTVRSCHISSEKKQPLRVVVSKQPPSAFKDAKIQTDSFANRTLFFSGRPHLEVLEILACEHDCNTVLLECGGTLLASFLEAGLVDEMVTYHCPLICGGPSPGVGGPGSDSPRWMMNSPQIIRVGDDLQVRGLIAPYQTRAAVERG